MGLVVFVEASKLEIGQSVRFFFSKKRYYISIKKRHKAIDTTYTTNPLYFSKF